METKTWLQMLEPDWDYNSHEKNGRIQPNNEDRCIACNRPVKDWQTTPVASVHMDGGGRVYPVEAPDDFQTQYDDMGWYTIGPECAKKLPKGYASIPEK